MDNEELKLLLSEKFKECPDAVRKSIESMADAGLLCEGVNSLSEKELISRYAKINFLTESERTEIMDQIPPMEETQLRFQKDYLRVLILLQDIERTAQNFDNAMQSGDINEGYRELRIGLMAYYLSDDARQKFSCYGKDDNEIRELNKKLAPCTTFLAHLRNYIAGHLDDVVLEKTCQWGGFCMFTKQSVGDPKLMILINKFLFETGINCCIASKPADKEVIGGEIDLRYPPDYKCFMNFMSKTFDLTYKFLSKIKVAIESKLKLYEEEKEIIQRAIWAGETNFNIKS